MMLALVLVINIVIQNVLSDIQIQSIDCDLGLIGVGQDIDCQMNVTFITETIANSSIIANTLNVIDSTNKFTPFCQEARITYHHMLIRTDFNSTLNDSDPPREDVYIYEGYLGDASNLITTCNIIDSDIMEECEWGTCLTQYNLTEQYNAFPSINITIYTEPDFYIDECIYTEECQYCQATSTLTLTCTRPQILVCNDDNKCNAKYIEVMDDDIPLYLYCVGNNSCSNVIVSGNNTDAIQIDCDGTNSCLNMMIYAEKSNIMDINCYGVASCLNMRVYANDATNVSMKCMATNSCLNMSITAQRIGNIELSCNDAKCENIYLDGSYAKLIRMDGLAVNATINGYQANNISINCDFYNSCSSMTVNAGSAENIDIECIAQYSCLDIRINAEDANVINTKCSGDVSCGNMWITNKGRNQYANNKININAEGRRSLIEAIIYTAGAIQINANGQRAFIDSLIYAETANHVRIYGIGDYVGSNTSIHAKKAELIEVDAIGTGSFSNSLINAPNTYIYISHIKIRANGTGSFSNSSIYGQYAAAITTQCVGDNSCLNMMINGKEAIATTIGCKGYISCSHATIIANFSGEIGIECDGDNTCLNSIIYATHATKFELFCQDICNNLYINGEYAEYISIGHGFSNLRAMLSYSSETRIYAFTTLKNSVIHANNVNSINFSIIGDNVAETLTMISIKASFSFLTLNYFFIINLVKFIICSSANF